MKLKQLQEKRGSLMKQCREILDKAQAETRSLTPDEQSKLAELETEMDGVNSTLEAEVRQLARESANPVQLNRQEQRSVDRFDLGVTLRSLANGTALEGVELEMVQEGTKEARDAGIPSNRGVMLPSMLVCRGRENRDMTATGTTSTTGDQGGQSIQTEVRGLIGDFYNRSIMASMGATVLSGLTGNLNLPRFIQGTAAAKKAENASADEVSPTLATLSLQPKRLPAFIDLSDQLLMQSSSNIEAFVRAQLILQMLATQEVAFFHGTGTNEANGLAGTSGIGSVAGGTNGAAPTYAHMLALEEAIDAVNALSGNLGYASNGQIRKKLKQTLENPSATDNGWVLNKENRINGYRAEFSNAISRTLTKGTANAVASAIFFGNWSDYIIAYWGGLNLELIRDSTNAKTGMHCLVANTYYDGGVIRPKSFSAMLDALGA
ncbi:phage major capsid protein [Luteolibacter yonseiensis]|uniref:Phage major capsid protein n=1 Tax=Luteolibacter yonseiensis TaxID=1144680 RepID=A0A934R5C5_9BACT|nr:phage major capsid protein [Luteolibacter yonseiensis]MBK1816526.1 phage major capsid protein [Luteolibacter yonseiensis]